MLEHNVNVEYNVPLNSWLNDVLVADPAPATAAPSGFPNRKPTQLRLLQRLFYDQAAEAISRPI
ncbi:MAG: hypothetical protein Q9172_007126 [Xanthocarpia lactea]